jgi:hypothetical protein
MPLVGALKQRWWVRDLDMRMTLIANTAEGPLAQLIRTRSTRGIDAYFTRLLRDERLYAVVFISAAIRLSVPWDAVV